MSISHLYGTTGAHITVGLGRIRCLRSTRDFTNIHDIADITEQTLDKLLSSGYPYTEKTPAGYAIWILRKSSVIILI